MDYRFGFNGKEDDGEWGTSLVQDYGFRLYNPGIGRFLSVDPLAPQYAQYTTYQFAGNRVINSIDLDGLEDFLNIHGELVHGPLRAQPGLRPANEETARAMSRTVEDIRPKKPIPQSTIHLKLPKSSQSVVYRTPERGANFANPMTAGIADGVVIGSVAIAEEVASPVLDAYEVYKGNYAAVALALIPYDRLAKKVTKSLRQISLDAGTNMTGRDVDNLTGYWDKERNNPAFSTINDLHPNSNTNCAFCSLIDAERQVKGESALDYAPNPKIGLSESEALDRLRESFGVKESFSRAFYPDIFEKQLLKKGSHGNVYNIAQDRGVGQIGHMMSAEVRYGQVWVRDGQTKTIQLFSDYTKTQRYSAYKFIKLGKKK